MRYFYLTAVFALFLITNVFLSTSISAQQKLVPKQKLYLVLPADKADNDSELEKLESPWVGIITQLRGKTVVNRFTDNGDKHLFTFNAEIGLVIHEKDELTTGTDSLVTIKFKNNTLMHLAPNSVFKIYRHYTDHQKTQKSLFNLLIGGIRASIHKLTPESSVNLYTTNATIGVRGTEFVVDYSSEEKETKIACFDGEVEVTPTLTEEAIKENSAAAAKTIIVKPGEFAKIDTIRDEKGTTPVVTEKKQLSDKVENSIKNSFTSDKIKPDDWDFARIKSSFFRFGMGYNLIMAQAQKYSALDLEWKPLFSLYSPVYLEAYIGGGALRFDAYYIKAGGNILVNIWHGLNIGFGGGLAAGIGKPGLHMGYSGKILIIDGTVNYTFLDKKLGFLDGIFVTFMHGMETDYYPSINSLIFGIILNFGNGREKW